MCHYLTMEFWVLFFFFSFRGGVRHFWEEDIATLHKNHVSSYRNIEQGTKGGNLTVEVQVFVLCNHLLVSQLTCQQSLI